jgi:hypothetical protein
VRETLTLSRYGNALTAILPRPLRASRCALAVIGCSVFYRTDAARHSG